MTAELVFRDLKIAFPDPNGLKLLPVEIVGSLILKVLKDGWPRGQFGSVQVGGFAGVMQDAYRGVQLNRGLLEHIGTAWQFLLSEQMLAVYPDSNASNGLVFVTEKGKQAADEENMTSFIEARKLPVESLHPLLRKVYPMFLHGDYDTAIFQAFKEVEIRVRQAGGFAPEDIGVPLMRKAFHDETGPLTNSELPVAEKQSMQALYAGAVGLFKNPQSHRNVGLSSSEGAVELILLASALLRMIDND